MKHFNFQTGKRGEEIASLYLTQKGYRLIEKNFRTRWGEIDLIATKKHQLIFVEVKMKTSDRFGSPAEMISTRKISQIKKVATIFLQSHPKLQQQYPSCRLDAVCITWQNHQPQIKLYENL